MDGHLCLSFCTMCVQTGAPARIQSLVAIGPPATFTDKPRDPRDKSFYPTLTFMIYSYNTPEHTPQTNCRFFFLAPILNALS